MSMRVSSLLGQSTSLAAAVAIAAACGSDSRDDDNLVTDGSPVADSAPVTDGAATVDATLVTADDIVGPYCSGDSPGLRIAIGDGLTKESGCYPSELGAIVLMLVDHEEITPGSTISLSAGGSGDYAYFCPADGSTCKAVGGEVTVETFVAGESTRGSYRLDGEALSEPLEGQFSATWCDETPGCP